jgi:alpha-ribazole phosphatase
VAANVVLCRHASTESNVAQRFLSTSDPPLSAQGRAQCERLREALEAFTFERCLVSPMRRCLETREMVAPGVPFAIERALREVAFGSWEGKTLEWLELHEPGRFAQRQRDPVRFRPPGGENFEDAAGRLRSLADTLHADGDTLVIGHRISLGILERLLRDLPLASPSVIPLEPGEFRTVRA